MATQATDDHIIAREKRKVALTSVLAAVFLTGFKVIVGLATGSLGILAEALHSALDLAAAAMTYAAVRIGDRPPDASHPYGHGKVESLSALFEAGLLVATCVWIIYEAMRRLFFEEIEVVPSLWAFAVMLTSILVDWGRSRALLRAARRFKSQALLADALHFSTDIWSSCVVIVGLFLVKLGDWVGYKSTLTRADSVAALGVALIVLLISYRLGKATIDVLLDRAPAGAADGIADEACRVRGVVGCRRVRVRSVGPILFVDMVVEVARATPIEQAHAIVSEVEARVLARQPQADVVVHFEPVGTPTEGWTERIQTIAGEQGLLVHEVLVREGAAGRSITLHLEVPPHLTVAEAHAVADRLEEAIRTRIEQVADVIVHIEPRSEEGLPQDEALGELERILVPLRRIAKSMPALHDFHDVGVRRLGGELIVSMHCVFDPALGIDQAHRLSSQIADRLKAGVRGLGEVHVHVEPPEVSCASSHPPGRGALS